MLTIGQKAVELYEKRIASYAKSISPSQKQAIINFQKLIFKIDEYGENTKVIDLAVLEAFWNKAEYFLGGLRVEKSVQSVLLQDIKDYADIEMSTRSGKRLIDYDIRSFYFKKSCDVRMQRHLIRYLNGQSPISTAEEIDRDILEEIEDDVDDLGEDKLTPFNGNRLLEALNLNDKAEIQEYRDFLNSIRSPEDLVKSVSHKISSLVIC